MVKKGNRKEREKGKILQVQSALLQAKLYSWREKEITTSRRRIWLALIFFGAVMVGWAAREISRNFFGIVGLDCFLPFFLFGLLMLLCFLLVVSSRIRS